MKKIKGKRLDNAIAAMFNKHGNRRQFNIMDLGKISSAGRLAYDAAATHEAGIEAADKAVAEACDKYEARPVIDSRDGRQIGTVANGTACLDALPLGACLAETLEEAAADAPPGDGDLDFRIPGLVT